MTTPGLSWRARGQGDGGAWSSSSVEGVMISSLQEEPTTMEIKDLRE